MKTDFMGIALTEARRAAKHGEVPIGAVIVKGERIIACAHNKREQKQNALAHAEVLAINKACRKLKSWRLDDCTMYVTLEPCQMCLGAITNARIKKVIYGARSSSDLNWTTEMKLEERAECSEILKKFFSEKR